MIKQLNLLHMKNKTGSPNRTGYSVLKLRLLIVLIVLGGYSYLGLNLWNKYHHSGMILFPLLLVATFCIAWLMSPIKINHNGFKQNI